MPMNSYDLAEPQVLLAFLLFQHSKQRYINKQLTLFESFLTYEEKDFYQARITKCLLNKMLAYNQQLQTQMYSRTTPNSELLLRQIVDESGVTNKQQQKRLRNNFKRKFSNHINLVQYHQLREDRFIVSQQKVLEKQYISIQKAKEHIDEKLMKANLNRMSRIKDKNKRSQLGLSKWQKVVQRHQNQQKKRIQLSDSLIKNWNDKLSQSSSRKNMALVEFSQHLKQKSEGKQKRATTLRIKIEEETIINPQKYKRIQQQRQQRYNQSLNKSSVKRSSRVSTENIYDKKKKQQENQLQKSLMKNVDKQQRITEARHIKKYFQERKIKQHIDKQQIIKKMREQHLRSIRNYMEQRNSVLDEKYKNTRIKPKNKSSLPDIQVSEGSKIAVSGPGEEWRRKNKQTMEVSPSKNYDRLIVEKLKDISMIMRKNRQV